MPVNVGYFAIRQPRVASINAATTATPSSSGSFPFIDGFNLNYIGNASKCLLYITGTKILTLCDDDQNHPDNLNFNLTELTLEEIINFILSKEVYSCEIISQELSQKSYLEGVIKHNLKSSSCKVRYNSQKEFFLEVFKRGELGSSTVNIKQDNFNFELLLNKWAIEDGFIHDHINVSVPSNGEVLIPDTNIKIIFESALSENTNDLENIVYYEDLELVKATDQAISSANFQAASILKDNFIKMANPSIYPTGSVNSVSWSIDNAYLAVAHKNSPFLTIYKRILNNFEKIQTTSVAFSNGEGTSVSWSPDNRFLAVTYDNNPFIDIYKIENEILTKITNIPSPDLPKGKCNSLSWSPDSSIISVSHEEFPYITHYVRSGDSFSKQDIGNYYPTKPFRSITWSNSGDYLICSLELYPHIVLYKKVGNNLFFITFNGDYPTGPVHSLAWDSQDLYLVAAHENFPFITIYKRSNDIFTKLDNPLILPESECFSVSWAPNSEYFSLGLSKNPYIINYKKIGDTFERMEDMEVLPISPVYSLNWSNNGKYLSISQTEFPYVMNYSFIKKLELRINQELALEGIDYKLYTGIKPTINSRKNSPYIFNSSNNTLRIRWNSEELQTFIFPIGEVTVSKILDTINSKAKNFTSYSLIDDTGKEFIYLQGKNGTANHQLRIEDGSANAVFGFDDFESKKGSGFGEIIFLKRVENEILTPNLETDILTLSGFEISDENPFLGIDVESLSISENDVYKKLNKDFISDTSGNINLVSQVEEENLVKNILKRDNDLYLPSYTLYKNGNPLTEDVDYILNPQGGWFNLEEGAFPGDNFTVDYINGVLGKIENEIIIGGPAILIGSLEGPFELSNNTNEFIVYIDNGLEQKFSLDPVSSISANDVALTINQTALGFKCYLCNNKLELRTDSFGGKSNIRIGNGSANSLLGFSDNQSVTGTGAEGGETALEVKNPPMDIQNFSAPQLGNTIIIKNNDVSERYPSGSIIKLDNNYYRIDSTYVENKANIVSSVPGPFTIISGSNDTFTFKIDDESEISVTFEENTNVTVFDIVNQINAIRPLTAKVFTINGSNKIQLLGESSVLIGFGNSNRTLGFDSGDFDTNTPDTYIKISGEFKTTYASPTIFTTVNTIEFKNLNSINLETPPGASVLKIEGDVANNMSSNKIISISGQYCYKIVSSIFNQEGYTEITLNEKIDIPIFSDTSISYSLLPVYEEGDLLIKAENLIYLENNHILKKNGNTLTLDVDYSIYENGEVELNSGVTYGDTYTLTYTARRFISEGTEVKASYSYFNFLPLKTNLRYSFQALNPDCFYLNVVHGSNILQKTVNEVSSNVQGNLSSGSSGFPTGQVPSSENDSSGVTTFNYTIGNLEDKIDLCLKVFEFYDERAEFFENEKKYLNGWVVGAESGRVTTAQVVAASTLQPPQRLFPSQDTRPFEQRSKPLRVPALDGQNKNDSGSSASGITSSYLLTKINAEKTQLNLEKSRLQNLLTLSISSSSLASTGNISSIRGETIILYVEARNGNTLMQRTVSVTLPDQVEYSSGFGGISTTINPSPSSVAQAINSAVNSAFSGITVTPATYNSSTVYLNASSSSTTKCCLVIQDTPNLGFGVGNQASIRSRHTSYTAGASYTDAVVPGSNSVELDNSTENSLITTCISLHNSQLDSLSGQMQEWLSSFEQAFIEAKSQIPKVNTAIDEANTALSNTTAFKNLKFGSGIFNSIDNNTTINNRILEINNRILELDRRTSEINLRISEINESLSREGLYNARYSWLVYLADKSIGYYATKTREIDQQAKRSLDASDGLELLNSVKNLF